jgi:membrane-associated phospholipid phosphatase
MNLFYSFGISLIQWLQTFSPALDSAMKLISFLGTIEFYLILVPFVYWAIDARLGFRLLLTLISADFFTTSFKQLLHQPRPYWLGGVQALAEESSYGIPSGHASDSLALWGYLAYRLKKGWLWAHTGVLVFLIGLSRLYLGVHFPTDVLAGWLAGLSVITIIARGESWAAERMGKLPVAGQIWSGFIFSILIILIGWLIGRLTAPYPDPPAWAGYALQARSLSHYFTLAGALFGAVTGYALLGKYARFQAHGPAWQRAARYLLGMVGLLLIYLGLDILFGLVAADETAVGLALRYVRYCAVTMWAMFGAPCVFLKLRLAQMASG